MRKLAALNDVRARGMAGDRMLRGAELDHTVLRGLFKRMRADTAAGIRTQHDIEDAVSP